MAKDNIDELLKKEKIDSGDFDDLEDLGAYSDIDTLEELTVGNDIPEGETFNDELKKDAEDELEAGQDEEPELSLDSLDEEEALDDEDL